MLTFTSTEGGYHRTQRSKQREERTHRESFPKQVAVGLMSNRVVTATRHF